MYTNLVLVMTLSTLFFHVSSLLESNFLRVWHLEDHLKHGRKRFIRKIIGEPTVRNANDAGVLGLHTVHHCTAIVWGSSFGFLLAAAFVKMSSAFFTVRAAGVQPK